MEPLTLIGGGLLLLMLIAGGGKKGKKKYDPNKPAGPGKGGLDEPAGPNGCADGLVNVDGICRLPPGDDGPPGGGGGRGPGPKPDDLAPDELWVAEDCETWDFGDGTGEAYVRRWMDLWGEYYQAGIFDPYEIAAQALAPRPCFNTYPMPIDYDNIVDLHIARELWERENENAYGLIAYLAQILDEELTGGDHLVVFDDNCDIIDVGPQWLDVVAAPLATAYAEMDDAQPFSEWPPGMAPKGGAVDASWVPAYWVFLRILYRMDPICGQNIYFAVRATTTQNFATKMTTNYPGVEALFAAFLGLANELEIRTE